MAKFFEYKQIFVFYSQEYAEAIVEAGGEDLNPSGSVKFINVMNDLGRGGWELVGFQIRDDMAEANKPNYSCCLEYIFKRES